MSHPQQGGPHEPLLSMPVYVAANSMNDTTRRLCAAPYLDPGFGNAVIREVVESERKAVPPSYGFDLDPVVRHCLRARRLLILRYGLVTLLLVIGLCVNPFVTVAWLFLCALIVGSRSTTARTLPRSSRTALIAVVAVIVLCGGSFLLVPALLAAVFGLSGGFGSSSPFGNGYGSSSSDVTGLFSLGFTGAGLVVPALLTIAMIALLFSSRRHALGVVTTELAPGVQPSAPRSSSSRVEWRLGVVAAMQRGNICVQDTDPFAGAGWREHVWSFAITLRPRDGEGRVEIDSAELNARVQAAVVGLRDQRLRETERIPNVYVVPYVAADGYRRRDDPLIDPRTRTPRTMASPEAIAAIAATPQGGLRHYLRAVVPASGKRIDTPDGRAVLSGQDSGVGVTAFVHLAVEGGLLYTEFVATVMPQVRQLYYLVDDLLPERVPVYAGWQTLAEFARDNLLGPLHLARLGWDATWLGTRMARSGRRADDFRSYDYGAHFSVRELAAQRPTVRFMQDLDSEKYVKLLDERGVDTTEFQAAVTNVSIDNATFFGGQQSFGGRTTNVQHNHANPRNQGGSRA